MFSNNAYATIWEIKDGRGSTKDVRISTSRKNQEGKYETDFSGYVRFAGKAAELAATLQPNDRIQIKNCGVTNSYNKEKKITYWNPVVFEAEKVESNGGGSTATPEAQAEEFMPAPEDEGLPFM